MPRKKSKSGKIDREALLKEIYFKGRPIFPRWPYAPWVFEDVMNFPIELSLDFIEHELNATKQPDDVDERWEGFLTAMELLVQILPILRAKMVNEDKTVIGLAFCLGRLISQTTPRTEDLLETNAVAYERQEASARVKKGKGRRITKQNTMKQDVLKSAESFWEMNDNQQLKLKKVSEMIHKKLEDERKDLESKKDFVAAADLGKHTPKIETIKRWIREAGIAPPYAYRRRPK